MGVGDTILIFFYNGFVFAYVVEFIAVFLYDLKYNNILSIPTFSEHVCLTACAGLPGLRPSGPK